MSGCRRNAIQQRGFAVRCGWHCTIRPEAQHLSMQLANGEQRVWCEVEIEDYQFYERPKCQGGTWALAQKMKIVKILSENKVKEILNKKETE